MGNHALVLPPRSGQRQQGQPRGQLQRLVRQQRRLASEPNLNVDNGVARCLSLSMGDRVEHEAEGSREGGQARQADVTTGQP